MIKTKKAQIALEALIIFGVITVGVILFGLFFLSASRNTMFNDSKLSKDKTTGQSLSDNLESAFNYSGDSQIGSSSIGLPEGLSSYDSNTGGNYGDVSIISDPEPDFYCGDAVCLNSENIFNCPEDCGLPYYKNFSIKLLAPEISEPKKDFEIKLSINTNDDGLVINKLEILDSLNKPTENCFYKDKSASSFSDLGPLKNQENDLYSSTKTFFCTEDGNYTFSFIVTSNNNPEVNINDRIAKTIKTPTITPGILLISPNIRNLGEPMKFRGNNTEVLLKAKAIDSSGSDITDNYNYSWVLKNKNTLFIFGYGNDLWIKKGFFPISSEYTLYAIATEKKNILATFNSESVEISLKDLASSQNLFTINSPRKNYEYNIEDQINFDATAPSSAGNLAYCTWYYYNIDKDVFKNFATNDCKAFKFDASEIDTGSVLIYVTLKEKNTLLDTKMTIINIIK